ncbi:MAG: hypothetical protein C7M88_00265 [Candidatus Arcticimaribacter sp.]|nr:MAG: hypothetical protein C7M88_00265 [Candidatus Arcticimaribacter sp.]PTM02083.1 MAG: hypothetical protein DA394_01880 [Candidatus Arcticimaribacter sp.]
MSYKGFLKVACGLLFIGAGVLYTLSSEKSPEELHQFFLENSPYKETHKLSKKERFKAGLPPNKYYEQLYDLTMDPTTGKPDIDEKIRISQQLEYQKNNRVRRGAVPGQSADTPWYTIGPNNQAGRTRAALFDLNDAEEDRVIAGGVSGGLWVNEDIDADPIPAWTQINIPIGNLAVSNIIQDPDDMDVMYVGTGESYTQGDVAGNGVYKSNDGGVSWTQILGSSSGQVTITYGGGWTEVEGYFYINDLALFDHDDDTTTQSYLYAALGYGSNHKRMSTTDFDYNIYGLYYSTDGGSSWSKITLNNSDTSRPENINDIEVQTTNDKIWLATTRGPFGATGGNYYYSGKNDGVTFTKATPVYDVEPTAIGRTEIASSETDPSTHYVLMSANSVAEIYKTTDDFSTLEKLSEPIDIDTGIPPADFTRGQSWYDLEIEVDPTDEDIVYVGGINWFRSGDGGTSWNQITKWANNSSAAVGLGVSLIHADQHGLYFRPSNTKQAVIVNDGGVAYCSDLDTANASDNFTEGENNFVTTQFYTVAQSPSGFGIDYVIGGTQDNGNYGLSNPGLSLSNAYVIEDGDGAATFFDQVGGSYSIVNYIYNDAISRQNYNASGIYTGNQQLASLAAYGGILTLPREGSFINPAALDSNQDIYFSNATVGTTYNLRRIKDVDSNTPTTTLLTGLLTSEPTTLKLSPFTTGSSLLFVGTKDGNIIKISNADTTPSATSIGNPTAGSVSDIHFGATEDDIYITYYNYGTSIVNVYFTEDGGSTWVNKEGAGATKLPDLPVYSILNNPYEEEEVIVGTELGVWKTLNFTAANPDWSLAYEGMSDVAVLDMDFRGASALDNRVIAGTFGRGIYVSSFEANTNPPVSVQDAIIVLEGGTVTTISGGATSVLSNDSDPDGDSITTDLVTNTINGVLALSATGSFTYTHDDSETTTDSFSYRAYDGAVYGNTVSVTITITPVEECPLVQTPLSDVTVVEDAADTVINFSSTFIDPEGDALTYTVTQTNTSLLAATINTTSLTLNYTDDMVGSATVTVTANDLNCGVVTSESFIITVNAVNDLPVGIADTILVNEGETVTVTSANATSVLFNDTDVEGETLSAGFLLGQPVPTLTPNLGTLSFLDNGTFSYTHGGTQIPSTGIATDTFFYRPYDGNGVLGNTTTVTIQITHTNDCPIVASAITTQTVMEDAADLDIDLGPVFTDEELNTITLTVSNTNTSLLTATLNTTTLTLDFVNNMTGSSTIILYASDGVCSTLVSSTFIVNVEPQNDAPVGTPDIINVNENETATSTTISITVLANDTDTEGDNLTATLVPGSGPFNHSGGAFSLQNSGTFVYNHNGSETTTDTFNYTLSDLLSSTIVSVTINIAAVNDCPEVDTPFPDITVNEDATDTVINLSPNFSDAENDALSFSFTNADTSVANVTLNTSTLTIQYIPEQNGTTTVTISVDDLNGCSTVQDVFLVNITAVNDPPITVTENLSVLEGGTVTATILAASSLLANDTDTENNALEAILTTQAINGNVVISSTGTFTYIHDGSETTTDTFQYRAAEVVSGLDGNVILVNIAIQEVNDCPIYTAVGGFPAANEDGAAWTWNYGAEISDADGNAPMYTLTHTATNLLTAVLAANGIVTFTPKLNQFGTTTMTLNVNDGRNCDIDIEIPVTINPINDCPTLENPTPDVSANEDDPDFIIPLAGIFADVDTTPLNYMTSIGNSSLVATSITATALIIDFLPNQSGSTFINLIALDGDMSCTVDDLFTVSITPVNDPPIGVGEVVNLAKGATSSVLNDGVTNSVLANDSDPEGDAITAILVTGPVNGTINLLTNGNFTYTHDNSTTVTDSFTYTPQDTFLNIGNTTTVTIFINNVPIGVTETIALFEGGTATTTTAASTSVLSNDTDVDTGDTAILTATIGTSPLFGTLALNANGSFTYTHLGSEDFTDSFTYIPFDGKGYGLPTVVSVTITPTNDAPVAFPDSITVGVGQTTSILTGGMNNVLMNDTDTDADPLTAVLVTNPTSGTLVLNPGGTFSYIQGGVMNAGDSFTYKANDGTLDSNIVTVNITLTCSPCTEKTIEAGSNGVLISYQGCDCRTYDVYVPKGRVFIFCHLDGSVTIGSGSYTVLSSKVCN